MKFHYEQEIPLNIILILFTVLSVSGNVIDTRLGKLQGLNRTALYGKIFRSYTKIPYAQPPIGNLRFQPPFKSEPWSGILNATQPSPSCAQLFEENNEFGGSEDCLYLDIHTPQDAKAGKNYSVLFYIFGGVFKFGNLTKTGPEFFMSRDIVLVIANYRLGALGFLSTGDKVISGNMGLKDQLLALKWVKENIYDFGGDPDKVTIHGHSSGAACVHLHTLSPQSRDYFHQAIMQSGLAVNPQMFSDRDEARGMTQSLAGSLNCPKYTSEEMAECLKYKNARDLVHVADTLRIWQNEPQTIFRPTIEDENIEEAFLTTHPVLSPYPSTSKPWLLGMTSNEAYAYLKTYMNDPKTLNIDPKLYLPIQGYVEWTATLKDVEFMQKIMKVHFFGERKIGPGTLFEAVDMLTGIMHGMGIMDVVEKYSGTKYLYLYDYEADFKKFEKRPVPGAIHADELDLLFLNVTEGKSSRDWDFGDELITRWVNFVHSGNPNIPMPINTSMFGPWNPVTSSRMEFLVLKENGTMEADYFQNRFKFWKRMPFFSKYSR